MQNFGIRPLADFLVCKKALDVIAGPWCNCAGGYCQ